MKQVGEVMKVVVRNVVVGTGRKEQTTEPRTEDQEIISSERKEALANKEPLRLLQQSSNDTYGSTQSRTQMTNRSDVRPHIGQEDYGDKR